jgi:hypothetical protein
VAVVDAVAGGVAVVVAVAVPVPAGGAVAIHGGGGEGDGVCARADGSGAPEMRRGARVRTGRLRGATARRR